jgi:hypothetical protein
VNLSEARFHAPLVLGAIVRPGGCALTSRPIVAEHQLRVTLPGTDADGYYNKQHTCLLRIQEEQPNGHPGIYDCVRDVLVLPL